MGDRSLRRAASLLLALAALAAASPRPARADGTPDPRAVLAAGGWDESSPGLFGSLPLRTAAVREDGIEGDFVLAPGKGLRWEKEGRWPVGPGTAARVELRADGVNGTSDDYRREAARFPVSVTFVFAKDAVALGTERRVRQFFVNLWRGFPPGGIRLTYAWGNVVPAGSMFRTDEEETVFVLGGAEDAGRAVASRRDLLDDFRAAYGREPAGPVTRVIIRAARPAKETGEIKASVRLTWPAP